MFAKTHSRLTKKGYDTMKMTTVQQISLKWGVSVRYIQSLCKQGRIPGAKRFGLNWMIPEDAVRPVDKRIKAEKAVEKKTVQPLIRKSPFLDMTDLYSIPGSADAVTESLSQHPEAQALFAAEIAYSRGEIDKVYAQARNFLDNPTGFYATIAGGMLLSLCAMWKGDANMWNLARKHLYEAPCQNDMDRDIVALSIAAADSSIRETKDYPDWFAHGCFDNLPFDAHPAARVYYIKYLMISAQDVAMNIQKLDGVYGLGLMKTLPYIMEPMISQTVCEKTVMAEIYLRLLCAIACHQSGNDRRAAVHLDKAIALCLADSLYGPLVEHRRQLGMILDERIALVDASAVKKVKELHKQLHDGWTKLHNTVLSKTVSVSLTIREREVARLAAFGLSDRQIAKQLFISEASVKVLVRSAKTKVGAEKRTELAYYI